MTQPDSRTRGGRYREWIVCFGLVLLAAFLSTLLVYLPMFAPGVGVTSDGQRAAYFETFAIWSQWFAGGWPAYADPTTMAFYPPKYVSQWLGFGLDGYIALALVIAGSGSGLLAWAVTRDRLAASFAAAVTPALGFFGAHISHTSIIHATCWAPLMLMAGWGLSRPAAKRAPWAGLLGLALGLSLLAGHPQLTVYALLATVAVAIPQQFRSVREWVGIALWGTLGTVIGLGIALPQLLPSMEFASFSGRAVMEGKFLSEFSASPGSLLLNIFPYLLGGNWSQGTEAAYLGPGSWNEVVSAIGVALLAVAMIGASRTSLRSSWWRFGVIGLTAAMLSVLPASDAAARLLVDVPVLGEFRAWARWLFVTSLCLVQMAAIGIASMRSGERIRARAWLKPLALVILVAWVSAVMLAMRDAGESPLRSFVSPPTSLQLAFGMVSIFALATALRRPRAWLFTAALGLCFLMPVAELAHLSRSMAWASNLMPTGGQSGGTDIEKVRTLTRHGGRLSSMSGWQSPNLNADESRIHQIPSINWYGPLLDQRFAQVSGLTTGGWTRGEVLSDANQALDIYGVSVVETYVASSRDPSGDLLPPITSDGIRLGPGCNESNPVGVDFGFDTGRTISQMKFYTSLACSVGVPQGAHVATILASADGAATSELRVVAGENTAEWSYTCMSDRPSGMHADPGAAVQVPLADPTMGCTGSVYSSVVAASSPFGDIESIRVTYAASAGGLIIHGASLSIDGKPYPVGPSLMNALSGGRWTIADVTDGGALLITNRRALPRFRFVDGAVHLEDEEALIAIQQSRLPDGAAFDARTTAILEPSAKHFPPAEVAGETPLEGEASGGDSFVVSFPAREAANLLLFGDNFNRHWQASSGGEKLDIMRTNYNQMSVLVPRSATHVRFDYVDKVLRAGIVLASISFLAGIILLLAGNLRFARRRRTTQ